MIESSRKDIEGLNGEQAWILISDGKTQMLHGDTCLSKASPLKYLESFLKSMFQSVPGNRLSWIKVVNYFKIQQFEPFLRSLDMKFILQVLMHHIKMVQWNKHTVQCLRE